MVEALKMMLKFQEEVRRRLVTVAFGFVILLAPVTVSTIPKPIILNYQHAQSIMSNVEYSVDSSKVTYSKSDSTYIGQCTESAVVLVDT